MKFLRKAASRILLLWSLLIAFIAAAMLLTDNGTTRGFAVPAFLVFGAPALGAGSWLAWGVKRQESRDREVFLQQVFYRLVKAGHGSIAPLQLAVEAQLNGTEAKAYLDRCVREFDGTLDVTDKGRILYRFDLEELDSLQLPPNSNL